MCITKEKRLTQKHAENSHILHNSDRNAYKQKPKLPRMMLIWEQFVYKQICFQKTHQMNVNVTLSLRRWIIFISQDFVFCMFQISQNSNCCEYSRVFIILIVSSSHKLISHFFPAYFNTMGVFVYKKCAFWSHLAQICTHWSIKCLKNHILVRMQKLHAPRINSCALWNEFSLKKKR